MDVATDVLNNDSNSNNVDQEMAEDLETPDSPELFEENSRPTITRQLSSNTDVSAGDFESPDSPVDNFEVDEAPMVGDFESPDSPNENFEVDEAPMVGDFESPDSPIDNFELDDTPLVGDYQSPDSPPHSLKHKNVPRLGSPSSIQEDRAGATVKSHNNDQPGPKRIRLVENYQDPDSPVKILKDVIIASRPLVEYSESSNSPTKIQGDMELGEPVITPDNHTNQEDESPSFGSPNSTTVSEEHTRQKNDFQLDNIDTSPLVEHQNFESPQSPIEINSDNPMVLEDPPVVRNFEIPDSPVASQDHVEAGDAIVLPEDPPVVGNCETPNSSVGSQDHVEAGNVVLEPEDPPVVGNYESPDSPVESQDHVEARDAILVPEDPPVVGNYESPDSPVESQVEAENVNQSALIDEVEVCHQAGPPSESSNQLLIKVDVDDIIEDSKTDELKIAQEPETSSHYSDSPASPQDQGLEDKNDHPNFESPASPIIQQPELSETTEPSEQDSEQPPNSHSSQDLEPLPLEDNPLAVQENEAERHLSPGLPMQVTTASSDPVTGKEIPVSPVDEDLCLKSKSTSSTQPESILQTPDVGQD